MPVGHINDRYQNSRHRTAQRWRVAAFRYIKNLKHFVRFGPGAVAAAGLAHFFAEVPALDTKPSVTMGRSIPFVGNGERKRHGDLLPPYQPAAQRARVERDMSGYQQVQFVSERAGRKLDKVQKVMKLLASSMVTKVDRYGALTDQTQNKSYYVSSAHYTGTAGSRITYLPVYAMDLTCLNQKTVSSALGGGNSFSKPFMRLQFNESTDNYSWTPVAGLHSSSTDAAPVTTWSYETIAGYTNASGTTPSVASENVERALLGKCRIGLYLTGARKYASTVWVQVVQFTDDLFCPPLWGTSVAENQGAQLEDWPSAEANESVRQKEFWLQQTQFLLENPLNKRTLVKRVPGMKVLFNKKFVFQPTATTENDPSGHEFVMDLKYHIDKVVDYRNLPSVDDTVDVNLGDLNRVQNSLTTNELNLAPVPKGRVYLLIRSTAPSVLSAAPTTAEEYDNFCSFDLQVTRVMQRLTGPSTL